MSNMTESDLLEQELGLHQKLAKTLLERQKAASEGKVVRVISQKVLIQERHSKLTEEVNQLHKRYATTSDEY